MRVYGNADASVIDRFQTGLSEQDEAPVPLQQKCHVMSRWGYDGIMFVLRARSGGLWVKNMGLKKRADGRSAKIANVLFVCMAGY